MIQNKKAKILNLKLSKREARALLRVLREEISEPMNPEVTGTISELVNRLRHLIDPVTPYP